MSTPPPCYVCNSPYSSRSPMIVCIGPCKKSFHFACVNIPLELKNSFKTTPGLLWKCESCLKIAEDLDSLLQEKFDNLLQSMEDKFASLETKVNQSVKVLEEQLKAMSANSMDPKMPELLHQPNVSFATVTSATSQSRLLLKPKNTSQSSLSTKLDVLKRVDPVSQNIKVKGVKTVKEGGLILGCSSIAERTKLKNMADVKLSEDYEVTEMNCILPKIRISGLTHNFTTECVEKYLRSQNQELFEKDSICEVLNLKPYKRINTKFSAEARVDPVLYGRLLKVGHVLIGMDPCMVYDSFEITRCFHCNEFNHTSSRCANKNQDITCPLCSGNHSVKECEIGNNKDLYKCSNCIKSNQINKTSLCIKHAVWDSRNCKVYQDNLSKLKHDLFGFPLNQ